VIIYPALFRMEVTFLRLLQVREGGYCCKLPPGTRQLWA